MRTRRSPDGSRPLQRFLAIEGASSALLLAATLVALVAANSPWREAWSHFWHQRVAFEFGSFELALSLGHWVNDALMALFFFTVGLEIKRELVVGRARLAREGDAARVRGARRHARPGADLPGAGRGRTRRPAGASRWRPTSPSRWRRSPLLGARVPAALKVFLLALAIVDDLGAVTVIAVFYTDEVTGSRCSPRRAGSAGSRAAPRGRTRATAIYFAVGAGVWLATLASGVHATVAGVLLGLLTPVRAPRGEAIRRSQCSSTRCIPGSRSA